MSRRIAMRWLLACLAAAFYKKSVNAQDLVTFSSRSLADDTSLLYLKINSGDEIKAVTLEFEGETVSVTVKELFESLKEPHHE